MAGTISTLPPPGAPLAGLSDVATARQGGSEPTVDWRLDEHGVEEVEDSVELHEEARREIERVGSTSSKEDNARVAEKINRMLERSNVELRIFFENGTYLYELVDSAGRVVRRIPPSAFEAGYSPHQNDVVRRPSVPVGVLVDQSG